MRHWFLQVLIQPTIGLQPMPGALRVALCSVAERDLPRVVAGLAKHAN